MFSRRAHLLTLVATYIVLPAIMALYRHAVHGLPLTEISGLLRFYWIAAGMIAPLVIVIEAVNIEQMLIDDASAVRKREVFRYALWKELHDKFFAAGATGQQDWFSNPTLRRRKDEHNEP